MKKVLIITGHFPPSNLAAVHRSRLFAQHLPGFGWEPIILTVHERYYEEELDYNLEKLVPPGLRVEKVSALKITRPRLIGDIGLRGFFQLYKKGKQIIKKEKIDFLFIHIPSFYTALLGRMLNRSTGIKYGIDYIDPWVQIFPGSDRKFSRHWFSTVLSKILEPIAVKKASLITGVAEGYYKGVIERNPKLLNNCVFGAMPYGGEKKDHERLKELKISPYLFRKNPGKVQLVYAGAMLPTAYGPLESVFKAITYNLQEFSSVEIHFIGTGKSPNDPKGYNIKPLAEQYGLWQNIIFEYPKRIPYLDVLMHLNYCDGVFVLGGTEAHYTPSKVYQAVLSDKPIFAILHKESSAVKVLNESGTGMVLEFGGIPELSLIESRFNSYFSNYLSRLRNFNSLYMNMQIFEQYSAKNVTQKLVALLKEAVKL